MNKYVYLAVLVVLLSTAILAHGLPSEAKKKTTTQKPITETAVEPSEIEMDNMDNMYTSGGLLFILCYQYY